MEFNVANIWSQLMISVLGMAFFLYGKNAQRMWPLMGGIVLSVYPYFVSDWKVLWGIAVGLMVGLYLMRDK